MTNYTHQPQMLKKALSLISDLSGMMAMPWWAWSVWSEWFFIDFFVQDLIVLPSYQRQGLVAT